ncbi:MAG: helix-turn-helix domain-containing protein [Parvibaculum sp.]|uniref:TrmB family transcriptional regulator n=1 Tax=Parvibaculum sp. TaxID=2024848 RepID=UPI00271BBC66|nr:helix-turn-helix domain-containing protein [Parvibaculum sp.]MDO8839351.1 helix-turn-helix domain-containing protein [Parvibaculum sp.]MDP2125629.1 helix-turn-helix domain-containing protein [Parvibaculum sp.]
MELENKLAALGLTGKRARFYLAALELGDETVTAVAQQAGIERTTAYALFEKLLEDGLVTQVERGGRTHVVAEDPDVLARNLAEKQRTLDEILPDLRAIHARTHGAPRFRLYDGAEGVRTVLHAVLAVPLPEILGILSMRELLAVPGPKVLRRFIAERVKSGTRLRVIRAQSEETHRIWQGGEEELREVRFAPSSDAFRITTFIFGSKVALISSRRENYGLIVDSEEFAGLQRALFETMWQTSTPA